MLILSNADSNQYDANAKQCWCYGMVILSSFNAKQSLCQAMLMLNNLEVLKNPDFSPPLP